MTNGLENMVEVLVFTWVQLNVESHTSEGMVQSTLSGITVGSLG